MPLKPSSIVARRPVMLALALALAGSVGGCAGFDPTDLADFLDTKKPLPGERRPVFPEGVPGLEQGVPKELVKGYRAEEPVVDPTNAPPAAAPEPARGRRQASRASASPAPDEQPLEAPPGHHAPAAKAVAPKGTKVTTRRRVTSIPKPDTEAPAAAPQAAPAQPAAPAQQQPSAFPAPLPGNTFQR